MNNFLVISEKDKLDRFIEKIQKEAEIKQKEALTEQLTVQQEEMNKLLAEQKVLYGLYPEMSLLCFSSFSVTVSDGFKAILFM